LSMVNLTNIEPQKILVLSANPKKTSPLRLGEEMREISEGLRRSTNRDQFMVENRLAVRIEDLRRALLEEKPKFVHFCGHGEGHSGILLEDSNGCQKSVKSEPLANLFKLFSKQVECVVLNACYSEVQANEIAQHIDYVIGMSQSIGDFAAIKFATGFYDAVAAGKNIEEAFEFGKNAIELESISEELIPVLKKHARLKKVGTQIEIPIKWTFVLSATIDDMDKPTVEAILEHLRKLSGDASLTLKKIDKGSVILTLEGSDDGFERIQFLVESGSLKELRGFSVQGVKKLEPAVALASSDTSSSSRTHNKDETEAKQLLLIDDDPNLILLVKDYLEFRGYQVMTAGNGREALSALSNISPDMIICDVMIPEMDGYAFVEKVRQDPAKRWIPILFLSPRGQSQNRVQGLTTGADVYMVKPFEPEELMAQIESSLKQATRLLHHQNKGSNSIPTLQVPFDVELTPVEIKVMQRVARGMANRQIADELKVSQRTIESHVSNMLDKTGLSNRTELARWAVECVNA
jgi:DNA-binding NarL/FixJ family response regulator